MKSFDDGFAMTLSSVAAFPPLSVYCRPYDDDKCLLSEHHLFARALAGGAVGFPALRHSYLKHFRLVFVLFAHLMLTRH